MSDRIDGVMVVTYYEGKRLEDMTKEELVDALKVMGDLYHREVDAHTQTRLRMFRRPPTPITSME